MHKYFHAKTIEATLKEVKSKKEGLTNNSAKNRLFRDGKNYIPSKKGVSRSTLFFRQFANSLVYILLLATIISFSLGHYSDAVFILLVLLLNTIVGFYQENKVNNSLEALKKMVSLQVKVWRNNHLTQVDSQEIVLGDVIQLKTGDKVPADCRLIEVDDLKVSEASLTGEWMAVSKQVDKIEKEAIISDMKNMIFMGTTVEQGTARAVVVATAEHTQFGKIVSLVQDTEEPKTPLQKKIAKLSKAIAILVVFLTALIIIEGLLSGSDFVEVLTASLALAVSAIPEGLLPATTVVLVLAMKRILKRKGLVKKLSAAEGLGSVTTVCTDKTGTLTEGNMQVSHILTSTKDLFNVEKGFSGKVEINSSKSDILALKIATMTNDAYIENPEDALHEWVVRGYFTDKALLLAGIHAGLNIEGLEKKYKLKSKLSFNSHLRFGATLRKVDKEEKLFVVGAPEEIINRSTLVYHDGKVLKLTLKRSDDLRKKLEQLTGEGLRVVACAIRSVTKLKNKKNLEKLAQKLELVGFIAIKDPVRKDVKRAMTEIQMAGVRPIIITGDHRLTAQAVAKEVGLKIEEKMVIEGKDLELMSDAELTKRCQKIAIYARALPEHKLKIVQALHRNNEVVAMFGDGVNDAPALKAADIGVAVGSGTDVAKEVADIILLDDSFKTIVKAIEQGRVVFGDIRKVFVFLVADNFSAVFLFSVAMLFGWPVPLLATQILWINLVEDGLPGIALTTEQETEGVMKEPPRKADTPIISSEIKKWMFSIFAINGLMTVIFFYLALKIIPDLVLVRTLTFAFMAIDSLFFAYSVRSFHQSIFRKNIFSNYYLNWAVIFSFSLLVFSVHTPLMNNFLETTPLSFYQWLLVTILSLVEILIFEIFKQIFFNNKFKKELNAK